MSNIFNQCAKQIVATLANSFGSDTMPNTGAVRFTTLPENRSIDTEYVGDSGGKMQIRITRIASLCGEGGTDCSVNICTAAGVKPVTTSSIVEIDRCVTSGEPLVLSLADFESNFCQAGKENVIGKYLRDLAKALLITLDKQLLKFYEANAGSWTDGSSTKQLQFYTTAGSSPTGQLTVSNEFLTVGIASSPYLIGGIDIQNAQYYVSNTTAPNAAGFNGANNMSLFGGFNFDPYIQSAVGIPQLSYAISPGVVQIVPYSRAGKGFGLGVMTMEQIMTMIDNSMKTMNSEGKKRIAINLAALFPKEFGNNSYIVDLEMYIDSCGDKVALMMKSEYALFLNTTSICDYEDFNGILRFTTCPMPAVVCNDPAPVPPSPVVIEKCITLNCPPTFPATIPSLSVAKAGHPTWSWNTDITFNTIGDVAALLNTSGIADFSVSGSQIKVTYTGSDPVVVINGQMQVLGSCA